MMGHSNEMSSIWLESIINNIHSMKKVTPCQQKGELFGV